MNFWRVTKKKKNSHKKNLKKKEINLKKNSNPWNMVDIFCLFKNRQNKLISYYINNGFKILK